MGDRRPVFLPAAVGGRTLAPASPRTKPPASASGCPEFDYAPGQPNLYRMMRYKQDLVARLGVENGYAEFREKLGWPRQRAFDRLRIESERDFAAVNGEYFLETAVAGLPFVNQPPVVHGEGNHRPVNGVTRSQY